MAFTSDPVVVPFATFVERRQRRNRVAGMSGVGDQSAADESGLPAFAVAIGVTGHASPAAAGKGESRAGESAAVPSDEARPELPKLAPR